MKTVILAAKSYKFWISFIIAVAGLGWVSNSYLAKSADLNKTIDVVDQSQRRIDVLEDKIQQIVGIIQDIKDDTKEIRKHLYKE